MRGAPAAARRGAPIRVGVLGCGAVAQMMHLPYLRRNASFDLVRVVDLSRSLAQGVAERFGALSWGQDIEALAQTDIDAVVIATSGSHGAAAAYLAGAGKHLLVEKPLCYTAREADDIRRARDAAGVIVQVGYMKRFDPAYRRARAILADGRAPSLLQVSVLHPRERRYLEHHRLARAGDVPRETVEGLRDEGRLLAREALGDRPAWALDAYTDTLLGSLVHDVNAARHLVGEPRRVTGASLWDEGRGIVAHLGFDGGLVGSLSWCLFHDDLAYRETIGVYGDGRRLELRFPSPYLAHAPTRLEIMTPDGDAIHTVRVDAGHAEAFEEELDHFRACIEDGRAPETSVEDAARDVALLRAVALAALDGAPVELNT